MILIVICVLGLRFQNEDDEMLFMLKLEEMCQKVERSKQAKSAESQISRYIGSQLTCLSVIHGNVALCMCSPIEFLYPFKVVFVSCFLSCLCIVRRSWKVLFKFMSKTQLRRHLKPFLMH